MPWYLLDFPPPLLPSSPPPPPRLFYDKCKYIVQPKTYVCGVVASKCDIPAVFLYLCSHPSPSTPRHIKTIRPYITHAHNVNLTNISSRRCVDSAAQIAHQMCTLQWIHVVFVVEITRVAPTKVNFTLVFLFLLINNLTLPLWLSHSLV